MICPRCNTDLPIDDFGICRARKDGRNLYCMSCNRNKTNEQREALRQMKRTREAALRRGVFVPQKGLKPTPELRVLKAIKSGAKTQEQIGKQARLFPDDLGDVLATLILIKGQVATRVIGDEREYFLKAEAA